MSDAQLLYLLNLITILAMPVLMTVFTVFLMMGRPKHRNAHFGYRTKRSMQSEESWAFAHRVCRKYFLFYALALWAVTAGILFCTQLMESCMGGTAILVLETLALLPIIPVTESALKKHF